MRGFEIEERRKRALLDLLSMEMVEEYCINVGAGDGRGCGPSRRT